MTRTPEESTLMPQAVYQAPNLCVDMKVITTNVLPNRWVIRSKGLPVQYIVVLFLNAFASVSWLKRIDFATGERKTKYHPGLDYVAPWHGVFVSFPKAGRGDFMRLRDAVALVSFLDSV
jgi:hypothetical protein